MLKGRRIPGLTALFAVACLLCLHVPAVADSPDISFAGSPSTTVPFDLIDNHVVVKVLLSGKGPFRFILDTGGNDSVTPDAARAAGLPPPRSIYGRHIHLQTQRIGALQIGGATMRNAVFVAMAFPQVLQSEPIPGFSGFLGRGFFHRFVVGLDYASRTVTLTDPDRFEPAGCGRPVTFLFNEDVPQVDGAVDGHPTRLMFDTGSRFSLLAPTDSALPEAQALRGKSQSGSPASPLPRVIGWGIGGAVRGRVVRAESVTFGGFTIDQPVLAALVDGFGSGPFDTFGGAVNLGGEILRKFMLTFDYGHRRIYLKPNGEFNSPIPADESGLWLNPSPDGSFVVADVMPESPAADSGFAVGDRITAVEGMSASSISLSDLRARLAEEPPGTQIAFSMASRGANLRTVTITLRDLAPGAASNKTGVAVSEYLAKVPFWSALALRIGQLRVPFVATRTANGVVIGRGPDSITRRRTTRN